MAQTAFTKKHLSGSTDGKGVKIGATGTPGTLLHTATAVAGELDEIWLWATNTSASPVVVTLEYGGTTDPDNRILYTVQPRDTLKCVIPGLLLGNGLALRAFAATADVLVAYGYANNMA